jgi:hypothetical protein
MSKNISGYNTTAFLPPGPTFCPEDRTERTPHLFLLSLQIALSTSGTCHGLVYQIPPRLTDSLLGFL